MSTKYLSFDRRKTLLESDLHAFSVSPNDVGCLCIYLKDDVLTLDRFRSRVELDRSVRVTVGVSVW